MLLLASRGRRFVWRNAVYESVENGHGVIKKWERKGGERERGVERKRERESWLDSFLKI